MITIPREITSEVKVDLESKHHLQLKKMFVDKIICWNKIVVVVDVIVASVVVIIIINMNFPAKSQVSSLKNVCVIAVGTKKDTYIHLSIIIVSSSDNTEPTQAGLVGAGQLFLMNLKIYNNPPIQLAIINFN